jgi:hypothetical protein
LYLSVAGAEICTTSAKLAVRLDVAVLLLLPQWLHGGFSY